MGIPHMRKIQKLSGHYFFSTKQAALMGVLFLFALLNIFAEKNVLRMILKNLFPSLLLTN